MSNETDKPLAWALKAAHSVCHELEIDDINVIRLTEIIARESGLAELVEAVEQSHPLFDYPNHVEVPIQDWNRIVAAARRVKGEC